MAFMATLPKFLPLGVEAVEEFIRLEALSVDVLIAAAHGVENWDSPRWKSHLCHQLPNRRLLEE